MTPSHQGQAPATDLDALDGLLEALTDVLDLRQVIDRVSEVTKQLLPHDVMGVVEISEEGARLRLHASAGLPDTVSREMDVPIPDRDLLLRPWDAAVVDDVRQHPFLRLGPAARAGMRCAVSVPVRYGGRLRATVTFFSRAHGTFSAAHVPVAKRIASHVALALSHFRLAEEASARRAMEVQAQEAADRAARLQDRVRALTDELDQRSGHRRLVGESPAWRQVLTQATQVARAETTVLLLGESGTGKEVVARFLHRASRRRDGPFVALNCAALPDHLLEAELFGFERGAFTGATFSKAGQVEQAAGGTLFLDEVGEMTPQAQPKLLRLLQEREFQRLGGKGARQADVRVIAATNRDLTKAIAQATFREDLYYRLAVFAIQLPPLRERSDDILPLSEAFLGELGPSIGRPPAGLSPGAREALMHYRWPGNVRELRNVLERAAILADGGLIEREHLAITALVPQKPALSVSDAPARVEAPPESERATIEKALVAARFNKTRAAQALGLSRAQLYVRMRRHGLE
jgi:transcriptional regulator with GAF, ATPase, and Fis domain